MKRKRRKVCKTPAANSSDRCTKQQLRVFCIGPSHAVLGTRTSVLWNFDGILMANVVYDTTKLEDIYHIFGDCSITFMNNLYAVNSSERTIQFDDLWIWMIYTKKTSDEDKFEKPRATTAAATIAFDYNIYKNSWRWTRFKNQYYNTGATHITDQDAHQLKDVLPMNYNAAWFKNTFLKESRQNSHCQMDDM